MAPANDLCGDAISIDCGTTVSGTTVTATVDNVGTCGTSNTAPGVWYSFVAPGNEITASLCDQADFDTKIGIFSGSCGSLSCVGGNDDGSGCSGFTSEVTVSTTPGTTYFILVHGFSSSTGDFDLTLTCAGPPPTEPPVNDLCANAISMDCGETVSGTTQLATFDNVGTCTISNTSPGVWYTFVATGPDATISTCNQASFDTKLSVFSGSCGSLSCVGGNDDGSGCSGFSSRLTVATTIGQTYWVLVHGFSASTGDFDLTITCSPPPPPPPANDACSGAIFVECGQTVSGTTDNANINVIGSCGVSVTAPDVWYTFVAEASTATVSTCDQADYDTKISVFSGNCGALLCIGGNDDGPGCSGFTSEFEFSTTPGETYFVLVHGFGSSTGDFDLTIDCVCEDLAPPTAVCKNATVTLPPSGTYEIDEEEVFNALATTDDCSDFGVTNISPASLTCANTGVTQVTVTVTDETGKSSSCVANVSLAAGDALPFPWVDTQIGNGSGSASYATCTEAFVVNSAGTSGFNTDAQHIAYKYMCGDGEIIAEVSSIGNPGWGGIQMRESLSAGSKKVEMKTSLTNFVFREIRSSTNGLAFPSQFFQPGASWLKLVRSGNNFMGYASPDGVNWQMVLFTSVPMSSCIHLGLIAQSFNNSMTSVTFENVSCVGSTPPPTLSTPEQGSGLTDATTDMEISVYPNPATDVVNVNLPGLVGKTAEITLINTIGKVVLRQNFAEANATEQIELNNLPNGVYLLQVTSEGNLIGTKRVMIGNSRP